MADLAGTNSIEYYLKGRALRGQREAQEARALAQQQKLEQDMKIAQERQKEVEAWHKMQNEVANTKLDLDKTAGKLRQAQYKSDLFDKVTAATRGIQANELEMIDPMKGFTIKDPETGMDLFNHANFRPTAKGSAASARVEEAVNKATALAPIHAYEAGEKAKAELPARTNQMLIKSELDDKAAKAQRDWQTEENRLNREAGTNRVQMRIDAAREKGDESGVIEGYLEQIKNGDLTKTGLTSLAIKERSKIIDEATKRKYRPLTEKEQVKLSEINDMNLFIQKNEQLHELIKKKPNVFAAWIDGDIQTLTGEIEALAKTFAVNVAGDRSILSEREVPRISQGIVQVNPSGSKVYNPLERTKPINVKANERRILDFKKVYRQRIKELYGNISPDQRHALDEKYGVKTWIPDNIEEVK